MSKLRKVSISLVLLSCFAITSKIGAMEEQIIATGHSDGTIKIWDINKPNRQENICIIKPRSSRAIKEIKFSPINKNILAFYIKETNFISVWNISDRVNPVLADNLTGHTRDVTCIAFSQYENILASGSKDGTIKIWDLSKQGDKCINTITFDHTNHAISPTLLKFSPKNKNMIFAAFDVIGMKIFIKSWDIRTQNGQPERTIIEDSTYIPESLEFDHFNKNILLLQSALRLTSWDLSKDPGKEYLEAKLHYGHNLSISLNPFRQNSIAYIDKDKNSIFMKNFYTEENINPMATTSDSITIDQGIEFIKVSPYKKNILIAVNPDNFLVFNVSKRNPNHSVVLDTSIQNDEIIKILDTPSTITSIDFMKIEESEAKKKFKTNLFDKTKDSEERNPESSGFNKKTKAPFSDTRIHLTNE